MTKKTQTKKPAAKVYYAIMSWVAERDTDGIGERFYIGMAWIPGGRQDAISTLPYRNYTEAKTSLAELATKKNWLLAFFDGEFEATPVKVSSKLA